MKKSTELHHKMTACLLLLHGAVAATILLSVTLLSSSCSAHAAMAVSSGRGCVASEREALVSLRKSFVDPAGRLSSWRGQNCCKWQGVRCDNRTGHVVRLDLHGPGFTANFKQRGLIKNSSAIAALRHLRYLDLSFNNFNNRTSREPALSFLGTLQNLRYLNLSNACFGGNNSIPSQLGNLSRLQYLDLSNLYCQYALDLTWLPRLSSLRLLDMSFLDLSSARDWLPEVTMLPNLKALFLSGCLLNSTVSTTLSSHSTNLTHLEILDLSYNPFYSLLQHSWFWDVTSIKELVLSGSGWFGPIPGALGNMSSLEVLYLDENFISGIVSTTSMKNLCHLQILNLERNNIDADIMGSLLPQCSWSKLHELHLQDANLTGQLPVWIGNLSSLTFLDLSRNMLVGSVPYGIGHMESLSYLDLSRNMLIGTVPHGIGNMKSLRYLDLSHNMLNGDVPDGIGSLSNLTYLGLGLNNFSGVLSEDIFVSLPKLEYLNLSLNSLKLDFSEDWVPPFRLAEAHLGSCDIGPQFPSWLRSQTGIHSLDISNTRINDVLPRWFWVVLANASSLDLSRNNLTGALPAKLELPFMYLMDLSRNSLSGQLSANLTAPNLRFLLLYNNQFTGTIPAYMYYVRSEINLSNNQLSGGFPLCQKNISLSMLDLRNNNLSGEFPRFLRYATALTFLDLSHNMFSGSVPTWIAEKMPYLEVLILRSNMFHGQLPKQLTSLVGLHYLDIAHNNISGSIPPSLARLIAMKRSYDTMNNASTDSDIISTFIKDRELNYTHELTQQLVLIDLSCNCLTGYIPKELSSLKGLRSFNLSRNQISGPIPDDIGALSALESLDLSFNYLTGHVPSALSDLTFLSCLNLSYNHLSGRIPSGRQLDTLNNLYMYIGNPGLCGPPLLTNCSANETKSNNVNHRHDGARLSLYLSMGMGFVMGLWTVFCTMLFMTSWRIAYFQILDQLYDKVYVQLAISKAAFLRKL